MQKGYEWLLKEGAPRLLVEGLKTFGTKETPGSGNNPEILRWAKETKLKDYTSDSIPWCGLWMAYVGTKAGWTPVGNPLWALNWAYFGEHSPNPGLGDILVFKRPSGGHVGIYVGEDPSCFHVLGGNQSDQVSITRIDKTRLKACRRPKWRVAQPANVRQIKLSATGAISNNEA